MRNYSVDKKRFFKGSVFLTFKTEEACTAFVEADVMKYKDVELIRMKQKPYLAQKAANWKKRGTNATGARTRARKPPKRRRLTRRHPVMPPRTRTSCQREQ